MQIHQVECNSALKISIDPVHRDTTSHVDYAEVGQVGFGYSFVYLLVLLYATKEIFLGYFWGSILVVGVSGADLQCNIRGQDSRIIAYRLEENETESFLFSYPRFDAGPR